MKGTTTGLLAAAVATLTALAWGLLYAEPARAADPVLVGAGDIASCNLNGDNVTADMLDGIPGTVFTLGDNVYPNGTLTEFHNCYGPSWGRHKDRTRPTPGNHDYNSGGGGYYEYFGANAGPAGKGFYSYDLGSWHVISLNSNVAADKASEQYRWLQNDLAANQSSCTVAMWHYPVFSSGEHGNVPRMAQIFKLLDEAGTDLALVGHDHNYERFAPQDYTGRADPDGLPQIVVGTGGVSLRPFGAVKPNSVVRNSDTHGLFKMTLRADALDFEFVPRPGKTFTDSGTVGCDGGDGTPPPDTTPPQTAITSGPPAGTTVTTSSASFGFSASEPDPTFECSLDGAAWSACSSPKAYSALPAGSHTFRVRATDAAGNVDATPASRTWSSSPSPRPTDGWDSKLRRTLAQDGRLSLVTRGDNNRVDVEQGRYLSLRFGGEVPADKTIRSVRLYVEHHEESGFTPNTVTWQVGGGSLSNPTVLASRKPALLEGEPREAVVGWDVTSVLNTPAKVNDAKIVWRNSGTAVKKNPRGSRLPHRNLRLSRSCDCRELAGPAQGASRASWTPRAGSGSMPRRATGRPRPAP